MRTEKVEERDGADGHDGVADDHGVATHHDERVIDVLEVVRPRALLTMAIRSVRLERTELCDISVGNHLNVEVG